MRVVLPLEGDVVAVEGEQSMIAEGDPMGIPAQVAQHRGCSAKRGLGVHHPVGVEEGIDEGVPLRRGVQVLSGAGQVEFVPIVRAAERLDKFPPKDAAEDFDGKEEARVLRVDPTLVIRRQAAGRHDAMHVRMSDQRLSPGVEDAEHANLCSEMSRIGGDLSKCGGARLKEPRVQLGAIPIHQGQERMREREDDVHIRHVEQLPFTGVEPALPRLRLTLRAVPIATRVIGDGLMAARAASVDVSAEGRSPAAHNGAEHRSLLHA